MRLLSAALLVSFLEYLVGAADVVPAPVDLSASQYFDGDDGPWSSFPIRVGTPEQDLRVFPSLLATSTWVIQSPLGCTGWSGTGAAANCPQYRGGNFTNATSSTWKDKGVYNLFIEQDLGYNDVGDYGFDHVGLGYAGTGVSLNSSLVTLITGADFIIGVLGLNPRPTNFSTENDRATSLLSLLYEQNQIPSLSVSYSAGAQYRFNGVLGSLTLGGYDDALYEPNNVTFDFYFDQTRDLTVGLQAITSTTSKGNTSLLPTPDLYFIDSTISQNYLAPDACDAFEKAFNITADNVTGYYWIDDAQHANLLKLNPNITFTLGQGISGGPTFDITLPYAAFDLNTSYPITPNDTRYFPIIRATNSTQYTLGRQFLQEAYLTVDYHRQSFSVSQRTWSDNQNKHIVPILPPNSTVTNSTGSSTGNDTNKSSGISGGAIGGIVVGVVVVVIVVLGGFFFMRRQRQRKAAQREAAELAAAVENDQKDPILPFSDAPGELDTPEGVERPKQLHSDSYFSGAEMDSSQVAKPPEMENTQVMPEMAGEGVYYELEAPHGMQELTTHPPGAAERQASTASNTSNTLSWKNRSPITQPKDGGG